MNDELMTVKTVSKRLRCSLAHANALVSDTTEVRGGHARHVEVSDTVSIRCTR